MTTFCLFQSSVFEKFRSYDGRLTTFLSHATAPPVLDGRDSRLNRALDAAAPDRRLDRHPWCRSVSDCAPAGRAPESPPDRP